MDVSWILVVVTLNIQSQKIGICVCCDKLKMNKQLSCNSLKAEPGPINDSCVLTKAGLPKQTQYVYVYN